MLFCNTQENPGEILCSGINRAEGCVIRACVPLFFSASLSPRLGHRVLAARASGSRGSGIECPRLGHPVTKKRR